MQKAWVKPHKRSGRLVAGHFKQVKSTNIKSFKYDADLQDLKIRFNKRTKDGADTYVYSDVPQRVVDGLDKASSKGKFFHKNIRPKFNYSKLQ
jgi:hypothetical protein